MPSLPKKTARRPWMPERKPFVRRAEGRPYWTSRWRKASKRFLSSHPLCVRCNQEGRTKASQVTDHIDHERYDFWDESGWQALCNECHFIKTGEEQRGKRKKKTKEGG